MRLYCPDCHKIHEFTNGEIERIIYAFLGSASDVASCLATGNDPNEFVPAKEYWFPCTRHLLEEAGDIEGYAEFVGQCVESRKHLRLETPSNRKPKASSSTDVKEKAAAGGEEL